MTVTAAPPVALFDDVDGVVHLPHLLRGRLVRPPSVTRAEIDALFAGTDVRCVRAHGAQVVRDPYDRAGRFFVVPDVSGLDLLDTESDLLATTADIPFAAIVAWLERAADALLATEESAAAFALLRATAPYPEALLDADLGAFLAGIAPDTLRAMVDVDLGQRGVDGSAYLDGWVSHDVAPLPEPGAVAGAEVALALGLDDHHREGVAFALRAMPTRQLHVTAGNSPVGPLVSVLRLALTKGVGTVKLASGALLPGALLALSLATADAGDAAPLLAHLSIVYWPGGDDRVERPLVSPGAFDRIVVWGDADAVASLRSRAPMTRVVSFDPRYGVSLVGREAFASPALVAEVAARAAADVCLHDQKACNASHLQYVEGTDEQVAAYADALRSVLRAWDAVVPPLRRPGLADELTGLRRGRLAMADWYPSNGDPSASPWVDAWTSGVVVSRAAFDVLAHPFARFVVVRPVASLEDEALPALSRHVSSAGVWPEARRSVLRTRIAARGVSSVLPLGRAEHTSPGAPHDGMLALSQLVDWARS